MGDADALGRILLCVLAHSKHNGVLENTYSGLLTVCTRLVDCGQGWNSVVETWLAELLASIRCVTSDSWLRRSRGNAFALMAICEAEPMSRPPVLLELAMACLIQMASTDQQDWRSLVHALNLLRSIFRDGSLHIRCLPHLSTAFECAIIGFSHSEWAVRNAAMIAFVPILAKACRPQQSLNVEAKEFFTQHANILPIVRSIIESQARDSSTLSPALYPICLLVENLRAGPASDTFVQQLTALIAPLLSYPHASIGQLVATSVANLTPELDAEHAIVRLTEQLPSRSSDSADHNWIRSQLSTITSLFQSLRCAGAGRH